MTALSPVIPAAVILNCVSVEGDAAGRAEFLSFCVRTGPAGANFDMDAILPMPAAIVALKDMPPVDEALGMAVLTDAGDSDIARAALDRLRVGVLARARTDEEARILLAGRHPGRDLQADGAAILSAFREHGVGTIDAWREINWGVDAEAVNFERVDLEPDVDSFTFETRFDTPIHVWSALAERFPHLSVDVAAFNADDEQIWEARLENGQAIVPWRFQDPSLAPASCATANGVGAQLQLSF